jgi:hypothetical protein
MPAHSEFLLVAAALYLWESCLWLPLRGVVLRKRWSGGAWKVLPPGRLIALRDTGLVALLPVPPDRGLAPCAVPPLMVDPEGNFAVEVSADEVRTIGPVCWDELRPEAHHLVVKGHPVRVSSARGWAMLSRARRRGLPLDEAVRGMWRLALSPPRAAREWRRWRRVSRPLAWSGPLLMVGFFGGLPLAWVFAGAGEALGLAAGLWLVMAGVASRLWWLGGRVYRDARSTLRMDALLALVVPFHAMRACEIAAVHAMATTHPAALLRATGDEANPWLAGFFRRLQFPRPGKAGDVAIARALLPLLPDVPELVPPDREGDPGARQWCPRCHAVFRAEASRCASCAGLPLRSF